MTLPRIKDSLYVGCAARIIGHVMLAIAPHKTAATFPHPVDPLRWPGYDQHNYDDVLAHCKRLKALGIDVLMYNSYHIGGWEDQSLQLYWKATQEAGLNQCSNLDKGLYDSGGDPGTNIRNYIAYLRKAAFVLPNYEKYNGKYIVTYFVVGSDDPTMFRQIETENPDIIFLYNDPKMGKNVYSWVHSGLESSLDAWCKTYATKKDGGLYIPHVAPGFDDTWQGHSVWTKGVPPRVWPPNIGPNPDTLKRHFDVINRYYNTANPLPYLQLVTVNDWDEKTSIEQKADGSGGFFANAAAPVSTELVLNVASGATVTSPFALHAQCPAAKSMEVWVDYRKFGNTVYDTTLDTTLQLPSGVHRIVVVAHASNGGVSQKTLSLTFR